MSQHEATLLLGSNLGDRKKNIEVALRRIETEVGVIIEKTDLIITDPVEFDSNNFFCNIAVLIKTQYSPKKLLNLLKTIEREMGRAKDTLIVGGYQDRIIDIDIVLYNGLRFYCKDLEIPHQKHMYERDFSRRLLDALIKHKKQ